MVRRLGGGRATVPLEAVGLSKTFGSTWALRDLDLEIAQGSVTALVGPNGAGKSTLLRTWVGFERPTRGAVRVHGLDPWRQRGAALRHLCYVPQSNALYRSLTCEDHIAFVGRYRPDFDSGWARRRLSDLEIPQRLPVRRLSGGQQAQVMLTLALATRGEVMLLDEPLANLDPLARRDFLHLVTQAVREEGRTAILSSHVVADMEQACDSILILSHGRGLFHGTIASLKNGHEVVPRADARPDGIGTFREATGELVTLVAKPSEQAPPVSSTPTLEQVVLGYLAGGEDRRRS